MSAPLVEQIANAVLYEGYILYPYRSSAVKNRQRWNFGVVYPQSYSELQSGNAPAEMVTDCLALGGPRTELSIRVRCLRLVDRAVGYLTQPARELPPDPEAAFAPYATIEIDGRHYDSWQEAAECEMILPAFCFADLESDNLRRQFLHPATKNFEPVRDVTGMISGLIVRTQKPLDCSIEVGVERPQPGLYRIIVRLSNDTTLVQARTGDREAVLAQSLLSAHTILQVRQGEFVSLLEPPPEYREVAAACHNVGTWPVLAGEEGSRDTMLSSPIILYDYPKVAPESPGDLFDGAEIDEILSLRILAMTDEEKDAMRRSDDRARRILERTESLPPEHFMKLHGALRGLRPADREAT